MTSFSPIAGGAGIVVFAAVCLAVQNNLAPVVFAGGTNPATLLLLRFIALVAVMAAWCQASGRSMRLGRANLLPGYLSGLLVALASAFVLTSFALIPVSLAILIVYSQPIITFLAECALDRRWPKPLILLCLAGAFVGLGLALRVRLDGLDMLGVGAAAAGAVCMAAALICNARLVKQARSSALTLHMSLAGLALAIAVTLIPGRFALAQDSAAEWLVLGLAVIIFGAGFFALFLGARRVGASGASQLMNLEPVLTVLLAVAFFGESLSAPQMAGAGLVIASIAAAQWLRLSERRG